jgi:GTP-binding protein HflX
VLAEIGAGQVPELVVLNKIDVADDLVVTRLLRAEPDAVPVSARTGAGLDVLRLVVQSALPQPEFEVVALVPYDRGDLVSRVFEQGDVSTFEHVGGGTQLTARVHSALLADLQPYLAEPAMPSG